MIKNLDKLLESDRMNYGNKAYTLSLLSKICLVPQGITLSIEEFDSFLKDNKYNFTSNEYMGRNKEIRSFIQSSSFSAELIERITRLLRQFENCSFAVRSSALSEDGKQYSMAGMFDSFIDIPSDKEVLQSIKGCYMSLFSDKVLDYYEKHLFPFYQLNMGIIIQKYIRGVFSGVVFPADETEQNLDHIIISYIEGACNHFVEGKQKSSYLVVDKKTGKIIKSKNEEKIIFLPETVFKELFETALKIEAVLGEPVDIEWTFDGSLLYILQARPITTIKNGTGSFEIEPTDKMYHWNLCDSKPMRPLLQAFYHEYFLASGEGILITGYTSHYVLHKIVNGYLYLHNSTIENKKDICSKHEQHLKDLIKQRKNIFTDEVLPELDCILSKIKFFQNQNLNGTELAAYVKVSLEYNKAAIRGHWLSIFGEKFIDEFKAYVTKLFGDIDTENYYNLVYVSTLKTKERAFLFQIADFIKSDSEQLLIMNSSSYVSIVYERLKYSENWNKLNRIILSYLELYGMGFAGQKRNPANTLMEKPQFILDKVKPLLKQDSEIFYNSISETYKNKHKLIQQIQSILSEENRGIFQQMLNLAEKSFATIDNHHYYCEDIPWGFLKTALNAASSYLLSQNKIQMPDDIYFFNFDELYEVLECGSNCPDIAARKAVYHMQKKLIPPNFLGTISKPYVLNNEIENNAEKFMLSGISTLKKNVKGKILIGPAFPSLVKEDCILVVSNGHMGDLFSVIERVKGLIVTGGSPFDHMGIIAREMEIPALYYVKNADIKLKNGDEVILNGVEGFVKMLNMNER